LLAALLRVLKLGAQALRPGGAQDPLGLGAGDLGQGGLARFQAGAEVSGGS
jgi:hypothetical protein